MIIIKSIFFRRTALAVFASAAVLMSAAAIAKPQPHVNVSAVQPGAEYNCKYIVSAYNGYVAVFTPKDKEPAYVTSTPLSSLPSADRRSIEAGIEIYSENQLTSILEDYES